MWGKLWRAGGHIVFPLLIVVWIVYSCTGSHPPTVNTGSNNATEPRFGQVRGTVKGCRPGEMIRGALVEINSMPDSLVADWLSPGPKTMRGAWHFDYTDYHDTVRTDSAGAFLLEGIPPGYYQLWLVVDLRWIRRDSCEQLAQAVKQQVDFVRVAPDTVSVVDGRLGLIADLVDVQFAAYWYPEYEPIRGPDSLSRRE